MRTKLSVLMLLCAALLASPDALAKVGKSQSMGSKGSHTTAPSGPAPAVPTLQLPSANSPTAAQSKAPPPAPVGAGAQPKVESEAVPGSTSPFSQSQPMYRPDAVRQPGTLGPSANPGMAAPQVPVQAQGGWMSRNPFMAGMLGGLVGTGIGSMLFGHSPAMAGAAESAPLGSIFGLLIQIALVGTLVWFLVRMFRRPSEEPLTAGSPTDRRRAPEFEPQPRVAPTMAPAAPPRLQKEFEVTAADQDEFTRILIGVQEAWSMGDLNRLKHFCTMEMAGLLSDDLEANERQGLINRVENVTLLAGEVIESWRENGLEFATAVLTFSAIDYTASTQTGKLVEGDRSRAVQNREAWTFVRSRGSRWALSAVERE